MKPAIEVGRGFSPALSINRVPTGTIKEIGPSSPVPYAGGEQIREDGRWSVSGRGVPDKKGGHTR